MIKRNTSSRTSTITRLKWKTKKDLVTGCWLFIGAQSPVGYGHMGYKGRTENVHRLSAHLFLGLELRDKTKTANHKINCPNKNCWNPDHIYVGTQA